MGGGEHARSCGRPWQTSHPHQHRHRPPLHPPTHTPKCCATPPPKPHPVSPAAIAANRPTSVAALLTHGANIGARSWSADNDWVNAPRGTTPLHVAARRKDVHTCKLLLRHYVREARGGAEPQLSGRAVVRRNGRGVCVLLRP